MTATKPGTVSWRILLALVLLGASFPWAQWRSGPSRVGREATGYYAQLTEAFLAGQLHLKAKPDPRLVALANPYAGEQGVPRPWDMTYYQGHFYLYFGTPPVFLLFAPFRLLTGWYLPDGAGTTFFGLAGFALGAWLLLRWRARYCPSLGEGWTIAGLAAWCLAAQAQLLAHTDVVYPVPINCAFACLMAAFLFCIRAWEEPAQRRWAMLGGLMWGLAIASRPNYLFSLGGLAVFLAGTIKRSAATGAAGRRSAALTLVAAGAPIALIGAGMAAYNWARFHRITEFGSSYMLMAGDQRQVSLFSGHVLAGLKNTLLRSVDYSPYFPFAEPLGKGAVPTSPILLAALALPWLWFRSPPDHRAFWRTPGTALLAAMAGNLAGVCLLQTQEYRYNIDFLPAAVLLALWAAWSLLPTLASASVLPARAGRAALALALALTLFHGFAANVAFLDWPQRHPLLSRWLDYPTHWIESALGYRYGPVRLQVRLPPGPPGSLLPLVVTGRGQDVLYLRRGAGQECQFGFFHTGAGGPESAPVALDPAREHVLDIDLGSLYPPPEHPLFAGRSERDIRLLKHRVRVRVDGHAALETAGDFYPSHPWDVRIGENPGGLVTGRARLARTAFTAQRTGLPAGPIVAEHPLQPVRLELTFPPFVHYKREPLVSTGHRGAGDLLYVTYVGPGQLRFAHDSWGAGSVESPVVSYEAGRTYALEVDMGSLHPHPAGTAGESLLRVQLDGRTVFVAQRPYHAGDAVELAFGYNGNESTATYPLFTGHIASITPLAGLARPSEEFGRLECTVEFPLGRTHAHEPLVVSGRTGAADIIYVVYAGEDTILIGYDHWGAGGPVSAPVRVDYHVPHRLEVSMGSLWPPAGDEAGWQGLAVAVRRRLAGTISVKVDGQTVLEHRAEAYAARPDEVAVGTNAIGASTCEAAFTGRILVAERNRSASGE
ncbi:MAG TPA: glycosyltransferase family 87 protein [Lacunisphaera sp.]|nr:glycosyltransferase family 87 protein [Lacunisphaera sp.]